MPGNPTISQPCPAVRRAPTVTETVVMTSDVTPGQSETDLGWLLEDFVGRVPGADSALLASSDGIKLAMAGLTEGQAYTLAAVMSGMHSLAKGIGKITGSSSGGVRQVVAEHDAKNLFVMSAGDGLPAGVPVPL